MSLARTLTFFVVDISPSMGRTRTVVEEFFDSKGEVEQRERTVTNLEWCLEFVSRKTQALVSWKRAEAGSNRRRWLRRERFLWKHSDLVRLPVRLCMNVC